MSDYSVTFARSARKELEALDTGIILRVLRRIEALAFEPRPLGCRKIRGESNLRRIRVGDYRVVYTVLDREQVVDIAAVRHRSEAYR
jgi:mRNA interferase RelE/StbE